MRSWAILFFLNNPHLSIWVERERDRDREQESESESERERERETEKRQSVAFGMHPTWDQTHNLMVYQTILQSTELPGQGWAVLLQSLLFKELQKYGWCLK